MPDPNIIGGSRVAWTAAIVLVCIAAYVLVSGAMLIWTSFPDPAAADPHVVASCFLAKG